MDTLDKNMLHGLNDDVPLPPQDSTFEQFVKGLLVPKNDALPKVNVVFVDMFHKNNGAGAHSFPVLPDHMLADRTRPGDNYKANILHITDAADIMNVPATITQHADADFTLIDLDPEWTPMEIAALEESILKADAGTNVFFAARSNDHTPKKRPHATEKIPTVSYESLGRMAALNWDNIVATRRKPPGKNLMRQIADFFVDGWCYTCDCPGNPFRQL